MERQLITGSKQAGSAAIDWKRKTGKRCHRSQPDLSPLYGISVTVDAKTQPLQLAAQLKLQAGNGSSWGEYARKPASETLRKW